MKNISLLLFLICAPASADLQLTMPPEKLGSLPIEWVDSLSGDFSFASKWDYPESIHKNQFGQLVCDGICRPEIDNMIDRNGRIIRDSISAYYRLVDTMHEYRSIECEAWCYEWAGSNTIYVSRKDGDTVECFSAGSAGTHCSLHLLIVKEHCLASIKVISIAFDGNASYPCKSGFIRIDRGLFARDILKGEFDMQFKHEENPVQKMFWKGKIYAKMAKK